MTGPLTNHAVLSQRFEPADSADFFPTPWWATRAACEILLGGRARLAGLRAVDPCCGAGDMCRPLAEYFGGVSGTDLHDRGYGGHADFLSPGYRLPAGADWIFMNPPFNRDTDFVVKALSFGCNVAAFLKMQFLEGEARGQRIMLPTPPSFVAYFSERVNIFKGRLDRHGNAKAMFLGWFVWLADRMAPGSDPALRRIPKCRRHLERRGDYPGEVA